MSALSPTHNSTKPWQQPFSSSLHCFPVYYVAIHLLGVFLLESTFLPHVQHLWFHLQHSSTTCFSFPLIEQILFSLDDESWLWLSLLTPQVFILPYNDCMEHSWDQTWHQFSYPDVLFIRELFGFVNLCVYGYFVYTLLKRGGIEMYWVAYLCI